MNKKKLRKSSGFVHPNTELPRETTHFQKLIRNQPKPKPLLQSLCTKYSYVFSGVKKHQQEQQRRRNVDLLNKTHTQTLF